MNDLISDLHFLKLNTINYSLNKMDDYLISEPWFIFRAWLDLTLDPSSPYLDIFHSWRTFSWRPDPETVSSISLSQTVPTIGAAYLRDMADRLTAKEQNLLTRVLDQDFDLFEICSKTFGGYLVVRSLLGNQHITVYCPALTRHSRTGDFVFGHILAYDEKKSVFISRSPRFSKTKNSRLEDFKTFILRRSKGLPVSFRDLESDLFNLIYDLVPCLDERSL